MNAEDLDTPYTGPVIIRAQGASQSQIRAIMEAMARDASEHYQRIQVDRVPPFGDDQDYTLIFTYILT